MSGSPRNRNGPPGTNIVKIGFVPENGTPASRIVKIGFVPGLRFSDNETNEPLVDRRWAYDEILAT